MGPRSWLLPLSLVTLALQPACNAESPPPAPAANPAPEVPVTPTTPATGVAPPPLTAAPIEAPVVPASTAGKVKVGQVVVPWKGAAGASGAVNRSRGDARLRADEALTRLRAGTPLSEVAKTYSEGPTARSGGVMGVLDPKDLQPPFGPALTGLTAPGQATEVLESPMGWVILVRL